MNYRLKTMEEMDACVFSSDMLYNDEERKHFKAMVARWARALNETENVAPPQREWQNAALRLGEELSTVGPDGYYNMSASEWLDWAMKHIMPARIEQEPPCKTGSQCVGGKCERCAVQEPVGKTITFMTRAIFNVVAGHQEINGGYFIADGDVAAFVDRLAKVINSTFEPLKPKNTTPPQREFIGLTDEEYETMAEHYVTNCYFDTLKYARAIEAKLREKNENL